MKEKPKIIIRNFEYLLNKLFSLTQKFFILYYPIQNFRQSFSPVSINYTSYFKLHKKAKEPNDKLSQSAFISACASHTSSHQIAVNRMSLHYLLFHGFSGRLLKFPLQWLPPSSQTSMQLSHPRHSSALTGTDFSSWSSKTSTGQTSTHSPQPTHFSALTSTLYMT